MLTTIRGTTYTFRRKVPAQARAAIGRGELWITLRTGDRRRADSTAALLRWLTDDLFARAGMADEDKDEIERLRREVAELQHLARFDNERRRVEELLRRKAEVAAEVAQVNGQNVALAKEAARLQAERDARTTSRLAGAVAHLAASVTAVPVPAAPPEPKASPAIDEHLTAFLDAKQYQQSIRFQVKKTVTLLTEIVGAKPVREYTREDAGTFYSAVLKLPSSHGKGGYLHALEAIKKNETEGKPTVMMKTLKRHFSALKQYWEYLHARGYVNEVIFSGFSFPGAKSGKSKRDDWSPEDLKRLTVAEGFILAGTVVWAAGGSIVGDVVGASGGLSFLLPIAQTVIMGIIAVGIMHAYVLPMLPYIMHTLACFAWLIFVAEAVIAAPLWALIHVRFDGANLIDSAQRPGYVLAFNLFLRPALITLGLLLSLVVLSVFAGFVDQTFYSAMRGATSGHMANIIGLLAMLGILTYLHWQLAVRSFALITLVPDRVARWFGAGAESMGETGDVDKQVAMIATGTSKAEHTKPRLSNTKPGAPDSPAQPEGNGGSGAGSRRNGGEGLL